MKMKKGGNTKGQTWSVDLIVGVVIFLLLVVVLYALLSQDSTEDEKLREQSDEIITRFDVQNNNSLGIPGLIDGENLNEMALEELYGMSYNEIKTKLGIEGELCIMVIDDTGGIVQIETAGSNKTSFGNPSDKLEVANTIYCGE